MPDDQEGQRRRAERLRKQIARMKDGAKPEALAPSNAAEPTSPVEQRTSPVEQQSDEPKPPAGSPRDRIHDKMRDLDKDKRRDGHRQDDD